MIDNEVYIEGEVVYNSPRDCYAIHNDYDIIWLTTKQLLLYPYLSRVILDTKDIIISYCHHSSRFPVKGNIDDYWLVPILYPDAYSTYTYGTETPIILLHNKGVPLKGLVI